MKSAKIVQLCPAGDGWRWGVVERDGLFEVSVACWALYDDGSVRAMCARDRTEVYETSVLDAMEPPGIVLAPDEVIDAVLGQEGIDYIRAEQAWDHQAWLAAIKHSVPLRMIEDRCRTGAIKEREIEPVAKELAENLRNPLWIIRRLWRRNVLKFRSNVKSAVRKWRNRIVENL